MQLLRLHCKNCGAKAEVEVQNDDAAKVETVLWFRKHRLCSEGKPFNVTVQTDFPIVRPDGSPNIEGLDTLLRREPLSCPSCGKRHIDEGEWATRRHHTHRCVNDDAGIGCGNEWRLEEYVFGAPL